MDVEGAISEASLIIQNRTWGMVRACMYIFKAFSKHSTEYKTFEPEERRGDENEKENDDIDGMDIIDMVGSMCEEMMTKVGTSIIREAYLKAITSPLDKIKFKEHISYNGTELPDHHVGYERIGQINSMIFNMSSLQKVADEYSGKYKKKANDSVRYILMSHSQEKNNVTHYTLNIYSPDYRNWVVVQPITMKPVAGFKDMVITFDGAFNGSANNGKHLSVKRIQKEKVGSENEGLRVLKHQTWVWVCMSMIMFSLGLRHINDHKYLWMWSDFVIPDSDPIAKVSNDMEGELRELYEEKIPIVIKLPI